MVVISTLSEDVATGKPLFKNQVRIRSRKCLSSNLDLLLQTSLYLRGSGGFGGPASSEKVIEPAKIPTDRTPDAVSEYQVNFIN